MHTTIPKGIVGGFELRLTQDDCATVLDNYPQVMIEIHHSSKLFLIIDEALLLGMGP